MEQNHTNWDDAKTTSNDGSVWTQASHTNVYTASNVLVFERLAILLSDGTNAKDMH